MICSSLLTRRPATDAYITPTRHTRTPAPTATSTRTPDPDADSDPDAHSYDAFPSWRRHAYKPVLKFVPALFPLDLSIYGIEITQGIQCFDTSKGLAACPDNSLPVIAKKDTTARIYLRYTGAWAA